MIDLSRSLADYFDRFSVVFWDFDGVIKESVEVKTQAYQQLFQDYGDEVLEWIKAHHELNGAFLDSLKYRFTFGARVFQMMRKLWINFVKCFQI